MVVSSVFSLSVTVAFERASSCDIGGALLVVTMATMGALFCCCGGAVFVVVGERFSEN